MIRLKLTDKDLQEIFYISQREHRTVLGVIYNNYLVPYFPNLKAINSKNIYTSKKFLLKLIELEKKLGMKNINDFYLNYGPSIRQIIPMDENEIMVILQESCN